MTMIRILAVAAALAFPGAALAQTAPPPQTHDPAKSPATTEAVGRIEAVDARAGTLTIHHAPIAALGWPAMTMTFKAAPTALQAAKAGRTVRFTLELANRTVTAIAPN